MRLFHVGALIVLLFTCSGCLSGSLDQIEQGYIFALQEFAEDQAELLQELQEGQISAEEYAYTVTAATDALGESSQEAFETFKAEAETQWKAVQNALTGAGATVADTAASGGLSILQQVLATLGTIGTVGGAAAGTRYIQRRTVQMVNVERDQRRKDRSEPV